MNWAWDGHTRRWTRSDGAEVVYAPHYARGWIAFVGGEPVKVARSMSTRTWGEPRRAIKAIDRQFPVSSGVR